VARDRRTSPPSTATIPLVDAATPASATPPGRVATSRGPANEVTGARLTFPAVGSPPPPAWIEATPFEVLAEAAGLTPDQLRDLLQRQIAAKAAAPGRPQATIRTDPAGSGLTGHNRP
jgi:hypothetical protein